MEPSEGKMAGTPGSTTVSTKLRRVAQLAKEDPSRRITNLAHHVDAAFLREAYRRTRKDGAAGVDGRTAKEYERDLEGNLASLLERFKSGSYRAPPVRRVHIPKGDGRKTRPIGIPTFEDKVLQRAIAMLLEAIYEQDFYDCSYGFRPRKSAHQAISALRDRLMRSRGGWVVEVDVQGFFDSLGHAHLRDFLNQRVGDGVIRRVIGKWLKAGVLDEGQIVRSSSGSPQGGVVSPILANVYLHYVLDEWFHEEVRPRLRGRADLVRYADDFVVVCEDEGDARRIMDVLPKRFAKYDLTIHPDKSKLTRFQRPGRDEASPTKQSFDFLGFTHFWALSQRRNWVVKRKTAKDRFARAVRAISQWCRAARHLPTQDQHRTLSAKLRGHCAYFGITGNAEALARFRQIVVRLWRKWLGRRSQRAGLPWERVTKLLTRYPLPAARAIHSLWRHRASP